MPEGNYKIINKDNNGNLVLESGNLGIGTTDPISKLTIMSADSSNGNSDEFAFLSQYNSADERTGYIQKIGFYGKEEYSNSSKLAASIECLYGDNLHIPTYPGRSSSNLIFKTGNRDNGDATERMRINHDGNIGIGTNNPARPLEIYSDGNGLALRITYSPLPNYYTEYRNNGIDINPLNSFSFSIEGNEKMRLHSNGYVGIGTNNPSFPLQISSPNALRWNPTGVYWLIQKTSSGSLNWAAFNWGVACHVDNDLAANTFFCFSDKRIKKDISSIKDDIALNRINQLESYEYNYIDPLRKKTMKTIGFIAQEVKEVIPNAVTIDNDWIPDEIRIIDEPKWIEYDGKYYLDIPDLDLSNNHTGKGKFYVSNDPSGNDEVCKEVNIKKIPSISINYVGEFDESWNNVFFYGKEVDDFHSLDKNQIFALHHSAIQELSRKNDAKTQEITELKTENNNKSIEITELKEKLLQLETKNTKLEADIALIKQKLGL